MARSVPGFGVVYRADIRCDQVFNVKVRASMNLVDSVSCVMACSLRPKPSSMSTPGLPAALQSTSRLLTIP
jgi:hypothetical protein